MATNNEDLDTCLVCRKTVNPSAKFNIDVFKTKVDLKGRFFIDVINDLLETNFCEENTSSNIACAKCYSSLTNLNDLQTKVALRKAQVLTDFQKTSKAVGEIFQNEDHDYIETFEDQEEILVTSPILQYNENVLEDNKESGDLSLGKIEGSVEEMEEEYMENPDFEEVTVTNEKDIILGTLSGTGVKPEAASRSNSENEEVDRATDDDEMIVVKSDDDIYTCQLCDIEEDDRSFIDPKLLIIHMKEKHELKLYVCDLCGDTFRKRTDLSNHVNEHISQEEGDFQCEVCNRIFNNLRLFRIHKRTHHPSNKSWACSLCKKKFSSKNLLEEHTNVHTGARPYVCRKCNKDFASKYTYKSHVKIHEDRPRPFKCNQCEKTFLSQQNLSQHQRTHNGVKDYICEQCGKAFGSAHNLEVHNIVHSGQKPYVCKACGKAFARKAEIRDHERTHTGEKPYQCEICGATFSQRSNLQSHKRATHYQDKRYKCDLCEKGFKRRRLLDYHTKAQHTGERPFKCPTCTATFVYPEHFKKHMRIHTGEKPYLCELCGKAFNSRDNRNAHRYIHSEKKPYECVTCGAGFMRKPLLVAHMEAQGHTNEMIVVNPPHFPSKDGELITLTGENVELLVQRNSENEEEQGNVFQLNGTEFYIAEFKDHVIVQENGEELYTEEHVQMDTETIDETKNIEQFVAVDGEGDLEGDLMECKSDQIFTYQEGEDEKTIVVPTMGKLQDTKHPIRLVQIQLPPSNTEDGKSFLSLVQES